MVEQVYTKNLKFFGEILTSSNLVTSTIVTVILIVWIEIRTHEESGGYKRCGHKAVSEVST